VRRIGWGHAICFTILVTCLWVSGIVMSGARADIPAGHTVTGRDCWAALEDPALAEPCRDLGWTVTRHIVTNPHGVVKASTLPGCTFEDGSGGPLPCGWNLLGLDTGNNRGLAYWIGTGRHIHYVWQQTPRPIRTGAAHWANRTERRNLDLDRTCWVNPGQQYRYMCPDAGSPS